MNFTAHIVAVGLALSLLVQPLAADELEDGLAAYTNGDYAAALGLLRPLATNGNVLAQVALGDIYLSSREVKQDYAEAEKWFRQAADSGHPEAQFRLGYMHQYGLGVPQDFTASAAWYRLSAEQNHAQAQFRIGWLYSQGSGVIKDLSAAVNWYRKAANLGDADAQFGLGMQYVFGEVLPKDYVLADVWYVLAIAGSAEKPKSKTHELATRSHNLVVSRMTTEQIAEAKRLSQEWLATHSKK